MIHAIGRITLTICENTGKAALFTACALIYCVKKPFYLKQLALQMLHIGYLSLPVVGLTAFFTGSVLALQIYVGSARFNAETIVPSIVALGITRELGPVIASLMVAGRVSAAIAAELGAMRVSEQIDALKTLHVNPMQYLVVPRLIAATLSLPLLVMVGNTIGIMGGYLTATASLNFNSITYLKNTANALYAEDILSGLIKAGVFGAIIALLGCYHGFNSKDGAAGVGLATKTAVVSAAILILAADYILTALIFS